LGASERLKIPAPLVALIVLKIWYYVIKEERGKRMRLPQMEHIGGHM